MTTATILADTQSLVRTTKEAIAAPSTARIFVQIFQPIGKRDYIDLLDGVTDDVRVIDLCIANDGTSQKQKAMDYIKAEFPGWKFERHWTPVLREEF